MKELCRLIVPALSPALHKGQAGKIGIVGGSEDYTGAPYFAGMSALRLGADLVLIMCAPSAAIPIKSYNPDIMVSPILCQEKACRFRMWLEKLNCIVFGPGLGRDRETKDIVTRWIGMAKERNIPIILDADALQLVVEQPSIIQGYNDAILTPNAAEFSRLYEKVVREPHDKPISEANVLRLTKRMGCTLVCKGEEDIICTGDELVTCDVEGSNRRTGGQGDLLSGAIGLFAFWAKSASNIPAEVSYQNLASYSACSVIRRANYASFTFGGGRSMITSDMINHLNTAFHSVFEK